MIKLVAEYFAIKRGTTNITIFDSKNMSVKDFIQDVINGQSFVPINYEKRYN